MLRRAIWIQLLGALLAIYAQPANALSLVPPTHGADDGAEMFSAPSPHIFALEIFNTQPGTSFGMFFESAPARLIPIFTPADGRNGALLYLEVGQLYLGPTLSPAGVFDPAPYLAGDSFGFYMQVDSGSGLRTLHTAPGLNDGFSDAVTTHAELSGDSYILSFELGPGQFALQTIMGLQSAEGLGDGGTDPEPQGEPEGATVPEPESWLLFALGLGVLLRSLEQRRRA